MIDSTDRIHGALAGLAAGDALGATVEFRTAADIAATIGRHRDIVGGGAFGWRPGQGTDDTDLAIALARSYVTGYSQRAAADAFLAWLDACPRDVGGITARALSHYRSHRNPDAAGRAALGPQSAGNGSLMRALATGLVRVDPAQRAREAAEISAITHADPRCVDSCIAYVELVAALLDGCDPADALAHTVATAPIGADARRVLHLAPDESLATLRPTGFVLDTLAVAVWALVQPSSLEDTLIDVVNLGGDADTTAAVAGGLLGARHGLDAIPTRWHRTLEYGSVCARLAAALAELRHHDVRGGAA